MDANYFVTRWAGKAPGMYVFILARLFVIFPQCIDTGEGSPAYRSIYITLIVFVGQPLSPTLS